MNAHIPPSHFAEQSQDEKNAWFAQAAREYRKNRQPADSAPIRATAFEWVDPSKIPPRRWIYGRHYIRQFVTETVAPGAYGKSTLAITEALAVVTGRALLGVTPDERVNVWVWNGEDPMEELQRRFAAACLHHRVDPSEIEGRLFVDTGRETKIILAEMTARGAKIAQPIVDQVIRTIEENKIGLLIIDPFVASHRVAENDNPAIELVASTWSEIADVTGCAIELVHHSRKTGGAEITVEDGRGGSALLAKARSARVLNGMTTDEAARAGVEHPRAFFRVANGKANLAPAADQAAWHQFVSIDLGNGDSVAALTQWTWPDAFDGVQVSDLRSVQSRISTGRWRESPQAKDWAGYAVASVLGLDIGNKAHKAKASSLLRTWIANDMLRVVEANDEQSRPRKFIEVGTPAND